LVVILAWEERQPVRLLALVCWCLWKHRNDVVLEGCDPLFGSVIQKILVEAEVWRDAGLFRAGLASVDRWRIRE
jgi:hypothetical protein